MATVGGDCAAIARRQRLKCDISFQIVKVRIQRSISVVVVDSSVAERKMPYGQLKDVRMTAGILRRRVRNVAVSATINLKMQDRMVDEQFAQADLPVNYRLNLQPDREFLYLQKGRRTRPFGAVDNDAI